MATTQTPSRNARRRPRKWIAFLRRRSVLARLLATILLAVCVPLVFSSSQFIRRESGTIQQYEQEQLSSVAQSIALQLERFMESMQSISTKIMLNSSLYENVIASNVRTELEGLELIETYQAALPFVADYALYYENLQSLYSNSGKYRPTVFAEKILHLPAEQWPTLLDGVTAPQFLPCTAGAALYVVPLRSNNLEASARFCLFHITEKTLTKALANLLADRYFLFSMEESLEEGGSRVIYQSSAGAPESASTPGSYLLNGQEYMLTSASCKGGYTLAVGMNKSGLYQNLERLNEHVGQFSAMALLLCLFLAGIAVALNYRPIVSIFNAVRGFGKAAPSHSGELEYILSAYSALVEETGELSYELFEKNILILDRALEKLLNGQQPSEQEMRLIQFNRPAFCVVSARIDDVPNAAEIIGHNTIDADVYAIEMYTDRALCFIASGLEKTPAGRGKLVERLRVLVGGGVRLAFSAPCDSLDQLSLCYMEALRALETAGEEKDVFAENSPRGEGFLAEFYLANAREAADLAVCLKNGDEKALDIVRELFGAALPSGGAAGSALQRYVAFRLVESCRALAESAGLPMDTAQLAQILASEEIPALRERFLAYLGSLLAQKQQLSAQQSQEINEAALHFIHENFANPLLSLNDVADHMQVSIYTASRLLKNASGVNFRKLLNDLRIEHAKDLLAHSTLSIQEIAEQSGFTTASYFVSVFKKSEGITPNVYRKSTEFHGLSPE